LRTAALHSSRDLIAGGKLKADFVSQVEALDASRTGAVFPPFLPHRSCPLSQRPGFVSSNELKRTLKLHGADLSQKDMEALTTQVFSWLLPS
jgi:hypothetical protein